MSKLDAAKKTRDATADAVADAIKGTINGEGPEIVEIRSTPLATSRITATETGSTVPLVTAVSASPSAPSTNSLIRVGITMPHALYDRVGDAQEVLRKARHRVSVSALFEVAMNELLARNPGEVLAAVRRFGGSARRDGRRT